MANKVTLKEEEIQAGYSQEDAYFYKADQELKEKLSRDAEDRRKARNLAATQPYWMKCPKCGSALDEIDMGGFKADRCSSCSGVYFDKSELEALVNSDEASTLAARLKTFLQA